MNFKETKSYCILSMPRTGSEVLMNFLQQSKLLIQTGEFLNFGSTYTKQVAKKVGGSGIFSSDYIIEEDPTVLDGEQNLEFIRGEFSNRTRLLQEYEEQFGPVVFKIFVNCLNYEPHYSLQYILENYNVIVLSRRDIFSAILSGFICERVNFWHGTQQEEFDTAKEKLNTLKFHIPPHLFYNQLVNYNRLVSLQAALFNKFPSRVTPLIYEDFSGDPGYMLNKFFGSASEVHFAQQKWITDHGSHISNLDELCSLYNIYGVKHEDSSLPKWPT